MKDAIDSKHRGTFQLATFEDGKQMTLSKRFPKNAQSWSLKAIIDFCMERQNNDTDASFKKRESDLGKALSSFKSESIYSTWINHLDGLKERKKIHPAKLKAWLHHGGFHASEKYELPTKKKK